MDMEDFCDNHCPMSTKLVCRDNSLEIDCDLEESECPFKDVDMSKVILNPLNSLEPPEKVRENQRLMNAVLEADLELYLEVADQETDDRIENLFLTTHAEHAKIHGFYEYNYKPRNTKGRPFYGNGFINADGTRK